MLLFKFYIITSSTIKYIFCFIARQKGFEPLWSISSVDLESTAVDRLATDAFIELEKVKRITYIHVATIKKLILCPLGNFCMLGNLESN